MRGNIIPIELDIASGMVSNWNDVLVAGRAACTSAVNVDYDTKMRTVALGTGAEKASPDFGSDVKSLHYFEYVGLDGAVHNEVLCVEGGDLHRIDSASTSTTVGSGLTDEPMSQMVMNDRLHLCSKNNDSVKYDGAAMRKWGVWAPATYPTERIVFDSASGWTATGGTVAADTSIKVRGTGSLKLTKTTTGSVTCYMRNSSLSLNLSGGSGYFYVYFFVDHQTFDVLSAVQVLLGDAGPTNYSLWTIPRGSIAPGFNLYEIELASPSATGGTGAPLATITFSEFLFTTAANADVGSVYFDYAYTTDDGTCSAAIGAAGALTGTYTYKITYVTKYGVESNAGPASNSVSPAAQRVSLTNIPVSPDTQVIARRIYRGTGGVWNIVTQIDDNSTTTYTDNSATLSSTTPPEAASATEDSSPPERMICSTLWRNHAFGINALRQIELDISNPNDPETWPVISRLSFQESLVALAIHDTGLLVFARDKTYRVTGYGTTAEPFVIDEVNAEVGANSWRAATPYHSGVVVHHENKLYLMQELSDPWLLNESVLNNPTLDDLAARPNSYVFHDHVRRRIMLGVPNTATDEKYQVFGCLSYGSTGKSEVTGFGPGVDPMDLRNGVWSILNNPAVSFYALANVETSTSKAELWAAQSDGYVNAIASLESDTGYEWLSNNSPSAVSGTLQFLIPLHPTLGGRGEIRYVEVDADGDSGSEWALTIRYYDSVIIDSVPSNDIGERTLTIDGSHTTVNPVLRGARGSVARLTFVNTSAERSVIYRIRVHVIPRFSARGQVN